jgi:hypothetical protein
MKNEHTVGLPYALLAGFAVHHLHAKQLPALATERLTA